MVKDDNAVIESVFIWFLTLYSANAETCREFNELVNMSAPELREWLQGDVSKSSGWHKSDSSDTETIGHERSTVRSDLFVEAGLTQTMYSGRKIVSILEHNPDKNPSQYDSDDLQHMRRVVAYCKRHLAQEETAKRNTNSKSYKSLKNWGHDPFKT